MNTLNELNSKWWWRLVKVLGVLFGVFILNILNSNAYFKSYGKNYYAMKERQCKVWSQKKLLQLQKNSIIVSDIYMSAYHYNKSDGNCYASINESISNIQGQYYNQSITQDVYVFPQMEIVISSYTLLNENGPLESTCTSIVGPIYCTDFYKFWSKYMSN